MIIRLYHSGFALCRSLVLLVSGLICTATNAQDPHELRLAEIEIMTYVGAFDISSETFGESTTEYSEGPIAYNAESNSLYIVGHTREQAIAEFAIPNIVNSTNRSELVMVEEPIQSFSRVLGRASGGNNQNINTIGGLLVRNGELFVNAFEYYDADSSVTDTTLVVRNKDQIRTSTVSGFFRLSPDAHAAMWMSEIPAQWQSALGGAFIAGASSGGPIISRHSVGPSAFVFDPDDMSPGTPAGETIDTIALLDFSLSNPLNGDLKNESGDNNLWTHLSQAAYGFIVPDSRTYLTIGSSSGHNSGIGYKITQDDGSLCAGYCAYAADDEYNYYWMWDIDDLVRVKRGELEPWEVRPYDYGELDIPFQNIGFKEIIGATFDAPTGNLYMTLGWRGDDPIRSPLIVVYNVEMRNITRPNAPAALNVN